MAGPSSKTKREFREKLSRCPFPNIRPSGTRTGGGKDWSRDEAADRSHRSKPHKRVSRQALIG